MNTDALVYLLEIAETGSFNKAAQNLFISQPALRSTISNLEKDLGGTLLNRTKYGCTLTPLGEKVVSEASVVLDHLNSWKDYALTLNDGPNEITLYGTKPFCSTILLPVANTLQQQLPNLKLNIHAANYNETIKKLKKSHCQIAIIHSDPMEEAALREVLHLDDTYIIDRLMENRFIVLLNKNDPLSSKAKLFTTDFLNHTFIFVSSLEMVTEQTFFRTGFNNQKALFFDSHHSIYQAVNERSDYYSILTNIFAMTDDYKIYPNLIFKPVQDFQRTSVFYLIYSRSNRSPHIEQIHRTIKNFCDDVSQSFL